MPDVFMRRHISYTYTICLYASRSLRITWEFISKKARVAHPGHTRAQRNKRAELPGQVRNEDRFPSMFCDQHTCQAQSAGQADAASQLASTPIRGGASQ